MGPVAKENTNVNKLLAIPATKLPPKLFPCFSLDIVSRVNRGTIRS